MAKRTRYSGRPTRSGPHRTGAGPTARPAPPTSPTAPLRSGGLTEAEVESAAQLEAELVAREQAAIAENARRRARSGRVDVAVTGNVNEPLSVRAAHEYAYVARDVRRIIATAALMLAILTALWLLVNVGGVGL
jgi:phage FluMu protein gp41